MKLCQILTVALTFLLLLLPAGGQPQKDGSPIIVGDGSVHIRSEGAHFDSTNWDMKDPKAYHRKGSGANGQYFEVYLIGTKSTAWSSSSLIKIEQLHSFAVNNKDRCVVTFTFTGSDPTETVTVKDEKGKRGMVIGSLTGFTGYAPVDGGAELAHTTANKLTKVEIYNHIGDPTVVPIVNAAKIKTDCRDKGYSGCGIEIDYK
jgi:hypothetical protein